MIKYSIILGLLIVCLTNSHANVSDVISTIKKVQKKEPKFFSSAKDKIKKTWHAMSKESDLSKKLIKQKAKKIVHKTKKKEIHHKKKPKKTKDMKKKIKHDVSKSSKTDKIATETKVIPINKVAMEQRKRVEKAERRRRAKRIEEEREIAMRLKKIAEDMRTAERKRRRGEYK